MKIDLSRRSWMKTTATVTAAGAFSALTGRSAQAATDGEPEIKPEITLAGYDYDRVRAIMDGAVGIPGSGTTVTRYFPESTKATRRPAKAEPPVAERPGAGEVVLVVEDEPPVRQLAVKMFNNLGYRTVEAEDGRLLLRVGEVDHASGRGQGPGRHLAAVQLLVVVALDDRVVEPELAVPRIGFCQKEMHSDENPFLKAADRLFSAHIVRSVDPEHFFGPPLAFAQLLSRDSNGLVVIVEVVG